MLHIYGSGATRYSRNNLTALCIVVSFARSLAYVTGYRGFSKSLLKNGEANEGSFHMLSNSLLTGHCVL
jgi:hypothetical protein